MNLINYNSNKNVMRHSTVKKSSDIAENDLGNYLRDIGENQDRIAVSNIFKHFAPTLKSLLVKPGWTQVQAEEIIQEVMIAVWTKSSMYDKSKSSVSTWIYTIAKNKRIDKIRKETRHNTVESDESLEIPVPSVQEEQLLSSEVTEKIHHSLQFLPKEQAELLKLSYFYEKTHSDIAKDLSLPLGTVKSRIRLALSKMKNLVELN